MNPSISDGTDSSDFLQRYDSLVELFSDTEQTLLVDNNHDSNSCRSAFHSINQFNNKRDSSAGDIGVFLSPTKKLRAVQRESENNPASGNNFCSLSNNKPNQLQRSMSKPSTIFLNLRFHFIASINLSTQRIAIFCAQIAKRGGIIAEKLEKSVNYVVVCNNFKDFDTFSALKPKYIKKMHIVAVDWLVEVLKQNKFVEFKPWEIDCSHKGPRSRSPAARSLSFSYRSGSNNNNSGDNMRNNRHNDSFNSVATYPLLESGYPGSFTNAATQDLGSYSVSLPPLSPFRPASLSCPISQPNSSQLPNLLTSETDNFSVIQQSQRARELAGLATVDPSASQHQIDANSQRSTVQRDLFLRAQYSYVDPEELRRGLAPEIQSCEKEERAAEKNASTSPRTANAASHQVSMLKPQSSSGIEASNILVDPSYVVDSNKYFPYQEFSVKAPAFEPQNSYAQRSKQFLACQMFSSGVINHNSHLTDKLERLEELNSALADKWREYAYRKAVGILKKYPKRVETAVDLADLAKIQGIGKKMIRKIAEILDTGTLEKLENMENDERIKTIEIFAKIHGVGGATAAKCTKNYIIEMNFMQLLDNSVLTLQISWIFSFACDV
jgi:ribosomal protein S13